MNPIPTSMTWGAAATTYPSLERHKGQHWAALAVFSPSGAQGIYRAPDYVLTWPTTEAKVFKPIRTLKEPYSA